MYHSWSGIQQQVFHPYLPGISMWVGRLLHYDRCSERLAKLSCHHHFARELGLFENSDIDQQHNNQKKKNTTDEQIIVKAFGGPRKGWAVETKV